MELGGLSICPCNFGYFLTTAGTRLNDCIKDQMEQTIGLSLVLPVSESYYFDSSYCSLFGPGLDEVQGHRFAMLKERVSIISTYLNLASTQ